MKSIVVKGAREHNLKNVDVKLPRDRFTVITGLSGSGKSTLAFDTIYAEGQRRYVESLSAYARQFLGIMNKPDVDRIEGLSPAISIDQKTTSKNPRSTVGTVTEVYDYLRLLFSRTGTPYCPVHRVKIEPQTPQKIADQILAKSSKATILAPLVRQKKGTYEKLLEGLNREGYLRARVDGKICRTDEKAGLERYRKHDIEVVIDRVDGDPGRMREACEAALAKSKGLAIALYGDGKEEIFSSKMACPVCGTGFDELEPRMFSFNSPFGACGSCDGLGIKMEFDESLMIPDGSLAIADGAIAVYRNAIDGWRGQHLAAVAKHYGFDVFTPISSLTKKQYGALLYGSDERIRFSMKMKGGDASWSHVGKWEGLIPQSQRLYGQTSSEYRRRELEKFMQTRDCAGCGGKRLNPKALAVSIAGRSIIDVADMHIEDCLGFFRKLRLSPKKAEISKVVLKEIVERLSFLNNVGLGYLSLSRQSSTLSGGEAQRIRLATQIGSNLMGVLYILDEPSIGLHQRDNRRLIETLGRLRDLGNTLLVIEHDEDTIRSADYVVDMGPGAGLSGGRVIAAGTPAQIQRNGRSLTGRYLAGKNCIEVPERRKLSGGYVRISGARENNLKSVDAKIPIGALTLVTGVSGSGKSTLIYEILHKGLMKRLHGSRALPGDHDSIDFDSEIDRVITIDQSPIGKTPRSNPATYTKVFDEIRLLFSQVPEARMKGYRPGRFSFNVSGGRCEGCEGDGVNRIEMNFLPDVYVECEDCGGKRYNGETLEVKYGGRSIAEVLDMSVEEAYGFFRNVPSLEAKLKTLMKVGLDYVKLGQSSTTLSGGEAQRIKLTRELSKKGNARTLYLLDEPTTGLHFHDCKKLIGVLQELVDKGGSVVVIEHNLDVIKSADHVIDLGPEGGDAGGRVVASGTPEEVSANGKSHTGRFLRKMLRSR